ncbi:DUF5017 domain-containing protein [Chitinophaga horti]|uniref:DUF5017 domain-containing protein n=1 Tax=Chitinophaga horti TaxID=2920382 RepID=A0ABY6IY03_9BACT|nr:DUF5017 domain-containing protein [Chitinophaga horti]UYQ92086.1 DUF5017 domain-containing protein [Chitinophaga horti]
MKRYCFLISALFAVSCSKEMKVDAPSFNATLDPSKLVADTFTYKLGDTTRFVFTGSTGNLAFYSGEPGKRYANRTPSKQLGDVILSFTSTAQFGNQTNTLKVLAASKINIRDSMAVVTGAWTDITPRLALATSATAVNSGAVNLSDLVSGVDDSLFIALKYSGVTGTTQRTWTITNWSVNNVLPERSIPLSTLADDVPYWTRFSDVWTPANARWTIGASSLVVTGGDATAATKTSWIITKPLFVGRIAPDVSVGVKSIIDPDKEEYTYVYPAAGVYTATFVAFNHTVDESKSIVKHFIIKVIP